MKLLNSLLILGFLCTLPYITHSQNCDIALLYITEECQINNTHNPDDDLWIVQMEIQNPFPGSMNSYLVVDQNTSETHGPFSYGFPIAFSVQADYQLHDYVITDLDDPNCSFFQVGTIPYSPCSPTCDDQTQNGDETGIDCGGAACEPCPCEIFVATENILSCNGMNTHDVFDDITTLELVIGANNAGDSGQFTISFGPGAPPYDTVNYDSTQIIQLPYNQNGYVLFYEDLDNPECNFFHTIDIFPSCSPTCDDNIQNGDELGVDCGGSTCEPCECDMVLDFYDQICLGQDTHDPLDDSHLIFLNMSNTGSGPSGMYDVNWNGISMGQYSYGTQINFSLPATGQNEVLFISDVDLPNCTYSHTTFALVPCSPTCDDQIQNGDETGVDCGGANCAPCACEMSIHEITYIGCNDSGTPDVTDDLFTYFVDATSVYGGPNQKFSVVETTSGLFLGTFPYGNGVFVDVPYTGGSGHLFQFSDFDFPNCTASQFIQEPTPCSPTGYYVDHTAQGNNDGSSWADAFTDLQDALAVGADAYILVAAGTYKPTTSGRGVSFDIPNNCVIWGGYPNGGAPNRDPLTNPVILSGDIDNDQTWAGNSFHVVKAINSDATLDGLTIMDGNADNANSFGRSRGGGVFANGATLFMKDCTIINNYALYGGGMFATLSPSITLQDCLVENNEANYGSALYHSNMTNMYIERTRIINNNSVIRCAVEINNSLYTRIENSIIANNESTNANAIAYIATNRDQSSDIINSTILGETKNKQLITFQIGFNDQLDVNIHNSIVAHQNLNFFRNVKAFNNGIFNFNHNNSYFQGSSVIGNGVNTLLSATVGDLMLNPDYSVDACSPVVDAGDNNLSSGVIDIDGNNRVFNLVDMGAYESQTICNPERLMQGDHTEMASYVVYPNPADDWIEIKGPIVENTQFELTDILGKRMILSSESALQIGKLPTGIYILKIMDDSKVIHTERVIKK